MLQFFATRTKMRPSEGGSADIGLRASARGRPPPARDQGLARAEPQPEREGARGGRVRRPALAEAVGTRRGPAAPTDHRRRAEASRRATSDQPHRHRPLRTDPRDEGHRRAEAALHPTDALRRRDLVPAVQRTGGGVRPGQRRDAGEARRRRVRPERAEDLDVARAPSAVRDPACADRPRRPEARRALLLHRADERAGRGDPPDRRRQRLAQFQRGVLHRRTYLRGRADR